MSTTGGTGEDWPIPAGRLTGEGALPPGSRVGRFQVQNLLGQGGMGAVYLAWDPVLERRVALKALRLGQGEKGGGTARFRREAMALAQVNHPHVCQVHDWVEARGTAYIAMEFVEGETLVQVGPRLGRRDKLRVLHAIARALEAAHAKGVVHRDLKPANVMVDGAGQVKVLDFGLARLFDPHDPGDQATGAVPTLALPESAAGEAGTRVDATPFEGAEPTQADGPAGDPTTWGDMTEAGAFVGSPTYASPEQLRGRKVGPASDLFSLGVLAWELFLAEHPFPGEGRARMVATLEGVPRSLIGRGLPHRLAALLRSLVARDPAQRPSATQAADQLASLLARKSAAWWTGVGLASLGLAVAAGYLVLGRGVVSDLTRGHPPRLAVMPVRNATGAPNLDAVAAVGLPELLSAALRDSPSLEVVEPDAVARTLSNLRLKAADALDPQAQPRIAAALGADLFLRSDLLGGTGPKRRRLVYQLVDRQGRVRVSGQVEAGSGDAFTPYELTDPAVHDLLRKVDPLRSRTAREMAVAPDVFQAYATGKALFLKGDFKGSEPFLREAALRAPGFPNAVSAYAACLRRLGRESAPAAANWALMAARATGDRWAEGRALGLKAYLAKDQGHLDEAQRLRESALALARSVGDLDSELITMNHLGLLEAERGRKPEAEAFFQRATTLARQAGDQVQLALGQNNLANLALNRGDLRAAETLYRQSLEVQQQLGSRWGEALALNNLGVVALMGQDATAAEARLRHALAIRETVGDQAGQASSLRNLGILALMEGQPEASQARHRKALALAEAAGMRTVEAECRFYLAELDRLRERFQEAIRGYRQVQELLAGGVTPEVRANAQAGEAECLARQSRPDLPAARRLLAGLPPTLSDSPYVHRARAWVAWRSGQREAAAQEAALAQADPRRQAPELQAELGRMRDTFRVQ